jgi:hypothetical protein
MRPVPVHKCRRKDSVELEMRILECRIQHSILGKVEVLFVFGLRLEAVRLKTEHCEVDKEEASGRKFDESTSLVLAFRRSVLNCSNHLYYAYRQTNLRFSSEGVFQLYLIDKM